MRDGNFLVQILRRSSPPWNSNTASPIFERRYYALLGLMCIYGIELLPDTLPIAAPTCSKSRRYLNLAPSDDLYRAASFVLSQNLIHGDPSPCARALKVVKAVNPLQPR